MMVIPRENGMVRLYIQLTEVKPDETGRADRSQITPASILKAAQKIIQPYQLTYEHCDWWTGYQVSFECRSKPVVFMQNIKLTLFRLAKELASASTIITVYSWLATLYILILLKPVRA